MKSSFFLWNQSPSFELRSAFSMEILKVLSVHLTHSIWQCGVGSLKQDLLLKTWMRDGWRASPHNIGKSTTCVRLLKVSIEIRCYDVDKIHGHGLLRWSFPRCILLHLWHITISNSLQFPCLFVCLFVYFLLAFFPQVYYLSEYFHLGKQYHQTCHVKMWKSARHKQKIEM